MTTLPLSLITTNSLPLPPSPFPPEILQGYYANSPIGSVHQTQRRPIKTRRRPVYYANCALAALETVNQTRGRPIKTLGRPRRPRPQAGGDQSKR